MLLIGSVVERIPGPKYASELELAELHLREPLPRPATLRKLRAQAPEGLALSLRAPASALCSARGPLRFDDSLERGLDWLLRASDALSVKAVVLQTPVDLTPGQRSRDLLAQYAERLPRANVHWIWAPRGPWEPVDRYRLARSLGLGNAFDPLEEPPPREGVAYARLQALGARKSFSETTLEAVLETLTARGQTLGAEAEDQFVSIDSPRSFDEAVRMQRLLRSAL